MTAPEAIELAQRLYPGRTFACQLKIAELLVHAEQTAKLNDLLAFAQEAKAAMGTVDWAALKRKLGLV